MSTVGIEARARAHAALGEPSRLAIIDLLGAGDLSSGELAERLSLPTNLLAHHLSILEKAGLVTRHRSEGDGRRTYVERTPLSARLVGPPEQLARPRRVAFVCSRNSARSQLAECYWRSVSDIPAVSAGTHPATRVHRRAITVARRHGLDLSGASPKLADAVLAGDELVVAVCDRAYEELEVKCLHWSIPDPAREDTPQSFEDAFDVITTRINHLSSLLGLDPP